MFESLTERLTQAVKGVTGKGRITEENVSDTVRQIRMALLEADVALPVAKAFVDRIRERALGEEVKRSLNPGQAFTKIVHDELVAVLGGDASPIAAQGRPTVLMLVGLQGAGKTTTAGKLVGYLSKAGGADVLLASTDIYRPAAREQLEKLAGETGAGYVGGEATEPEQIAVEAVEQGRQRGSRWVVIDTAGRLHVDEAMMEEARAIHARVQPAETLFVVDAMAGQDAVNSARAFHEAVPLTGVVLTKVDGDARGGAALSVREVTGAPIKLVGRGEKLEALDAFVPERFANRILGMGDVVGLVEQVESQVDRDAMERVARKVKRGRDLTLEDFREQLVQLKGMGGFESLLDKLPGVDPAQLGAAGFDPGTLKRQIAAIDSMTVAERRHPTLIDGSRRRRIAAGAGLAPQDVSRLLKQHKQLVKTMKRVSKSGGMQGALGGMLGGAGAGAGAAGRAGRSGGRSGRRGRGRRR